MAEVISTSATYSTVKAWQDAVNTAIATNPQQSLKILTGDTVTTHATNDNYNMPAWKGSGTPSASEPMRIYCEADGAHDGTLAGADATLEGQLTIRAKHVHLGGKGTDGRYGYYHHNDGDDAHGGGRCLATETADATAVADDLIVEGIMFHVENPPEDSGTMVQSIVNGTTALTFTGTFRNNFFVDDGTFEAAASINKSMVLCGVTGTPSDSANCTYNLTWQNNTMLSNAAASTAYVDKCLFVTLNDQTSNPGNENAANIVLNNNILGGITIDTAYDDNSESTDGTFTYTGSSNNMADDATFTSEVGGTGNLDSQTLADVFENVATDFRLKTTSLARDAGTTTVAYDALGETRPKGPATDMGALEMDFIAGGDLGRASTHLKLGLL